MRLRITCVRNDSLSKLAGGLRTPDTRTKKLSARPASVGRRLFELFAGVQRKLIAPALVVGCLLVWTSAADAQATRAVDAARPNILFIAVDDLNDWIGCLEGHPQSVTPNFDRLAQSGVLFTNAHCPAPACNPSRSAIFTGRSPHKSGLYRNDQPLREVMPDAVLLPRYLADHGYRSIGSGKMLHYFTDARSWDAYSPPKDTENPIPWTLYPDKRPVNLPVGGPWQYVETDWGPLDVTDKAFGGDYRVSEWVATQLAKQHDQPLFLACGIYRPHEPWFVPKKYFDRFPLDEVQLPPGYLENDLDDLPPQGKRRGPNRYFAHIREQGQWKQGVQGYLASIAFADAMLGRVLDALDNGPNRDNTIVVLWSDHGWHLGEKQHWQKFTAWRACTRVPLMIRVPAGISTLTQGTKPGSVVDAPVSLLSLYPTLTDLAGVPRKEDNDGPTLLPLLADADAAWPHVAVTYLHTPGAIGLSDRSWRYIRYPNDDEELYHIDKDPYEWDNLANQPAHAEQLKQLRTKAPTTFAPMPKPSVASLIALKFHPAAGPAPASKPEGGQFDVYFINESKKAVELCWSDEKGELKKITPIQPGKTHAQPTRPGAVWVIRDDKGQALGHFIVGDRSARAVIREPAEPDDR